MSGREELRQSGVLGPLAAYADDGLIADLRQYCHDILNDHPVHPLYGRPALRDWHLVNSRITELFTAPELMAILAEATGAANVVLWRTKIFHKWPGEGPLDWHQDYGYFDGEEVGGHRPALYPLGPESSWNWTVWIPLTDVTADDGVMEFVLGTQAVRYPTRLVQLPESGAFVDPRTTVTSKEELLALAEANALILDIPTRDAFTNVNHDKLTIDEIWTMLLSYLNKFQAVVTEPFTLEPDEAKIFPMSAGQVLLFDQRTMHRSRAASSNSVPRIAIAGRFALGSTLVYPQRLAGEAMDGSNLDITKHRVVRAYGSEFHPANVYL